MGFIKQLRINQKIYQIKYLRLNPVLEEILGLNPNLFILTYFNIFEAIKNYLFLILIYYHFVDLIKSLNYFIN